MTPTRTAAAVLATALLGGCAGTGTGRVAAPTTGASTPVTATPGTTAPGVAQTTAAPDETLSPWPAVESPAPLGQPTCRAAALTVTDADSVLDETTVHEVFLVRTAGRPCELRGWPAVRLLDRSGRPLAVTVGRGGYGLPPATPGPVTLSAGTTVSFLVGTRRAGSCHDAAVLEVTLPGTSAPLRTATGLQVCDGAGTSPVQRLTAPDDNDQTAPD